METSNNLLSLLTREGVLINVSVRYWRGCKKLNPEDLGLKAADVSDRLISLGHKRLLPKEATAKLALVEGRAHALIENNTFPFLNGLGHFLPNTRLQEVTDRLKELEDEFWEAKKLFLDQYQSLRSEASKEWKTMAQNLVKDPEQLVATIESSFPYPQRMERYYGFDVQLFQITLPEQISTDLLNLDNQREVIRARQQAAQAAAVKIRNDAEAFVAECVKTLREQTGQLCEDMLNSIQCSENGVHQKTLNRLVRFIDQFKQMNFANDVEMERQLERVRQELLSKSAEDYRGDHKATTSLLQGLTRLRDMADDLAEQDATELVQRFGELGKRKFHLAA